MIMSKHCPKCNTPYQKKWNRSGDKNDFESWGPQYDYCTKCKQFDYEIDHELKQVDSQTISYSMLFGRAAEALKNKSLPDHNAFTVSEVLATCMGLPKEIVIEEIRKSS